MAEPKNQKTTPVRLTDEAIKWARIASGYTGESMAEYVSRITAEQGKYDAERYHAEAMTNPSDAVLGESIEARAQQKKKQKGNK